MPKRHQTTLDLFLIQLLCHKKETHAHRCTPIALLLLLCCTDKHKNAGNTIRPPPMTSTTVISLEESDVLDRRRRDGFLRGLRLELAQWRRAVVAEARSHQCDDHVIRERERTQDIIDWWLDATHRSWPLLECIIDWNGQQFGKTLPCDYMVHFITTMQELWSDLDAPHTEPLRWLCQNTTVSESFLPRRMYVATQLAMQHCWYAQQALMHLSLRRLFGLNVSRCGNASMALPSLQTPGPCSDEVDARQLCAWIEFFDKNTRSDSDAVASGNEECRFAHEWAHTLVSAVEVLFCAQMDHRAE